jgi:phosphotransferase system HPr-like phosphotransfer protein
MSEVSLEEVVSEEAFAGLLQGQTEMFFRLAHTLVNRKESDWNRRDFFQLTSEADTLEAFLDDYGARHNRTFHLFREIVASVRGFALAGVSITHLTRRLDSYGTGISNEDAVRAKASIEATRSFVQSVLVTLMTSVREEASACGLRPTSEGFSEELYGSTAPRLSLPRNVGQEDLEDEEQKVAEVVAKYLQACEMFQGLGIREIEDEKERETFLSRNCSEERARVYEATVHNLQSVYDTYVKNTLLESKDERLPRLRGHASVALHLLEAVTHLTHFVERHGGGMRHDEADVKIEALVSKSKARDITLNHLLVWASRFMQEGRSLADDLLPSYTNVQLLEAELPEELLLHARPAALIVGIVNHYGTPVEMEVEGHTSNAGSILELMVAVGSNPKAKHFKFRGDENPLRDIAILFAHDLGENGINELPAELGYLKDR